MLTIVNRKISKQEETKHFKNIKTNGFTVIKNFIPKNIIKKYLDLTKEIYRKQKINLETPNMWRESGNIYNLQGKSDKFLKIFNSTFLEKILIKKLNDPYFRNLAKDKPNYILNNFKARSSGRSKLHLHIDSGIPTGDVTTFIQIMIPLEKISEKNACTIVVPKSHKSKKFANQKTKKYELLRGEEGDVFIWDGNLWHGSLPNKSDDNRWALVATFSNWQFKQAFDIPRTISQKIYSNLTVKEKNMLGYLSIPPNSEYKRVTRTISPNELKKNVQHYFPNFK
jgi:ectoine hydroxylase-related dioxygenase (phytanoyl-CoA dioxygenase family)